ncbi:YbhB/YbcL family Raf kinase inhibitor-like protein [Caulobacter sp. KR2-114]|uniref:YbhB/YbcL family Raf kinase inhibitor-like protein n=1 Tax=Caulobacter sp. KR2-114 TaxID=3400912 RepID=UPI003BFFA6AB
MPSRFLRLGPLALVLSALAGCGGKPNTETLAIDAVPARQAAPLTPTSMALAVGGAFGPRQSAYANNLSPPLAWATTPGAQAYAVVIEDPDAEGGRPFVHWLIWNIPGDAVGLPEGVPLGPSTAVPPGASQGMSDARTPGYFGPHPPAGAGVHHYHVELFALDQRLDLKPTAQLPQLKAAMTEHVLAKGELVATYAAPK